MLVYTLIKRLDADGEYKRETICSIPDRSECLPALPCPFVRHLSMWNSSKLPEYRIPNSLFIVFYLHSGATAADALSAGYRTILIEDCCRGVDLKDIEHTNNTLLENNGVIIQSREVFITYTLNTITASKVYC